MHSNLVFNTLNHVDSTNNYAMEQIHAGLANHGMAWFAREQISGKGQRGKTWNSAAGENIILSTAIVPPASLLNRPFLFNAIVSLTCKRFIEEIISETVKIKWPNDLIIRDRKSAGILIENNYRGKSWNWAVVGVGINVNQTEFPENSNNPISIKEITGETYNPELLARKLHQYLMDAFANLSIDQILANYNNSLFKMGEKTKLRTANEDFDTTIIGVNEEGLLMTSDVIERNFQFGEVEWICG